MATFGKTNNVVACLLTSTVASSEKPWKTTRTVSVPDCPSNAVNRPGSSTAPARPGLTDHTASRVTSRRVPSLATATAANCTCPPEKVENTSAAISTAALIEEGSDGVVRQLVRDNISRQDTTTGTMYRIVTSSQGLEYIQHTTPAQSYSRKNTGASSPIG